MKKRKRRKRKITKKPLENITIEVAGSDEKTFIEVFELTLMLHKEGGILPLDRETAAESVYNTLLQGMTLIARNEAGDAIGSIGIEETSIFYSTETMLWDKWLIVLPQYRNGDVGKRLMAAATEVAEAKEKILVVTITNPNRQRKAPMKMSLISQEVGYVPKSYSIRLR